MSEESHLHVLRFSKSRLRAHGHHPRRGSTAAQQDADHHDAPHEEKTSVPAIIGGIGKTWKNPEKIWKIRVTDDKIEKQGNFRRNQMKYRRNQGEPRKVLGEMG